MPSLPRTPSRHSRAPQRFCQSELECRHAHSLWVAVGLRGCGWLGCTRPFHRKGPLDCRHWANPTPVRFHTFTRPPTKHTDELLLLPTFQQTCPDKTKFSGSQGQRYSLRLVFLPQGRKSLSSCRIDWGFDSVTKGSECADHSRSALSL